MELKFIKLNTDIVTQVHKVHEEVDEFVEAIVNDDKENLIEEFWDVMQAMLRVIDIRNISKEELREGLEEHYNKLESRGHKFK